MGIANKIIIAVVLFSIMFGLVSITEASSDVVVSWLDVTYDMVSYTGYVGLENIGDENITTVVGIFPDDSRIAICEDVVLNIEYCNGFKIASSETIEFEAPCEEGCHEVTVVVLVGNITLKESGIYEAYGCIIEDEEDEEEVDRIDWLCCP